MPETAEERRARQATIEQAATARLHGVEMPKRLDFNAKKLHHEYLCFKTLAKKVLDCYGHPTTIFGKISVRKKI